MIIECYDCCEGFEIDALEVMFEMGYGDWFVEHDVDEGHFIVNDLGRSVRIGD